MLYRPGLLTYDNYGLEGYRTWPRNVITRTANPVYDEFGDFLVNGVEVYHLRENRRFDDPAQVFSGSTIAKPNNYEGFLNRLMVADDSYNSWQTRLIIGDRIRTHFSPLILDLAALNGIRWDLANERHNFSVLASRMDKPVLSQEDATALSTAAFAAYLLGGHWQWNLAHHRPEYLLCESLPHRHSLAARLEWHEGPVAQSGPGNRLPGGPH